MTLTVIKVAARWRYESELTHGTPSTVSHEIHVPDEIIANISNGEQRYRFQPHAKNLIDRGLTADQLLRVAELRISSEIYIVTTII